MPEKFSEGNVDTGKQAGTSQVDNFSKELSDFLSDEKLNNKEQISNFLISNSDLKNGFEDFLKTANLRQKIKCKKELQNCSTEEKIKSIILENIPEGYKVGNNGVGNREVTETTVEDEDFINLTEQARTDREQARTDREQARTDREQARTDREQARTDREQARTDREQARTDTEQVKVNKEKIERAMEIAKVARQDLLNNHPKGKEIDEKARKEAEKFKKKLPEETKKQLEEKGYDENFINDYILLRVTANEVKKDASFDKNAVAQFEKSVNELSTLDIILKNIDNSCNFPDTNLNSFSSENISQTRTELFNEDIGNDSLIKAKKSNLESRNYSEMLPEMGNEEMFKKYGQFLQGDLRKCWDEYKDNYLGFVEKINSINAKKSRGEDLVPEDQSFLSLEGAIKGIKEQIDNKTKDMVEELCIISQIKGMYMCMGEGADFDLNKANEIENDNGILTLRGHIDGVDFAIRQDTNNPEARLQTSKRLIKDESTFTIGGKDKDNFVDSNFILPGQDEIFDNIAETVTSESSLENFDNVDEYFENLQSNIMGDMKKKYENTKYVHHYMQNQVKGEKIVDNSIGLIQRIKPSIDLTKVINRNDGAERKMFDFMKILDFNIENSTAEEKDKLNRCINEIENITNNYKTNKKDSGIYSENVSKYLENDKWLDTSPEKEGTDTKQNEIRIVDENINLEKQDQRLGLIFDMFIDFNKNSTDKSRVSHEGSDGLPTCMIINDLYMQLHDKPKQKQAEINEQKNKEIAANQKYEELMDAYDTA